MIIDDLALMVKRGFDGVTEEIGGVRQQIGDMVDEIGGVKEEIGGLKGDVRRLEQKMDDGFRAVNKRLDLMHEEISDVPDMREAVEDHEKRLGRLERNAGVAA